MADKEEKKLHIVMYPWLALGHMTPFLHLANKLAQKGHKISFFLPPMAHPKLAHLNLHPNLITFVFVNLPAVDGLPSGAQTTGDTPFGAGVLLFDAFDLTRPFIESCLSHLKPDFVVFDYAHWLPALARKHGAKSIYFSTTYISLYAFMARRGSHENVMQAPLGFPSRAFFHRAHEARSLAYFGGITLRVSKMNFPEKMYTAIEESDAVCCKSCREMEGPFGDYFEEYYRKPVLWVGPLLDPAVDSGRLDEMLDGWLKRFEERSVVYCALGSEFKLSKDQFQELVLGLELTNLPFLAVLKPPHGCETVESALPEGFSERVNERGIIQNTWVQQQLILKHRSTGCFITHCGAGSLSEALVSECQLVLLPQRGDQYMNARLMSEELRVGVEVEKGEDDGIFTKEGICNAVMKVMEKESKVGKEIRTNHAKWREVLLRDGFEDMYINEFLENLQRLVTK